MYPWDERSTRRASAQALALGTTRVDLISKGTQGGDSLTQDARDLSSALALDLIGTVDHLHQLVCVHGATIADPSDKRKRIRQEVGND